ncbi:hypothetical protein [Verrucomicrobium sp. BvORR106]|uniref:hypothetical protein n=1 Tax=Verrucomicrobium sp. BvORR106 TaxID=1403819 RepID=UPI0005700373|nr:hypothetical protein [Verrucomicrobium sp. BvORR106]
MKNSVVTFFTILQLSGLLVSGYYLIVAGSLQNAGDWVRINAEAEAYWPMLINTMLCIFGCGFLFGRLIEGGRALAFQAVSQVAWVSLTFFSMYGVFYSE